MNLICEIMFSWLAKRFSTQLLFTLTVRIVIIFCVAVEGSRKFDILRQRVQRIEDRLAEDLSLIREEFYEEIHALAEDKDKKENESTSTAVKTGTERDLEAIREKVDGIKNALSTRMNIFNDGIKQEKRIRRELQGNMRELETEMTDLNTAFSDMSNNITSTITDTVKKAGTREKLSEIVELLENISEKLEENFQKECGKSCKEVERVSDCADWLRQGHNTSGVYTVFPETIWRPIKVYCDMETFGGGWTVFQRRRDGSENFEKKWIDYMFGFGNIKNEFWLGNEFIHRITALAPQELLVELEDFENDHRHAVYGMFSVGSAETSFKLSIDFFSGNVTDSLLPHNGSGFSTSDHGPSTGCAKTFKGGWWYRSCHLANLNGLYLKGEHKSIADGVNWISWRGTHYSLKKTEMKFRPH